KSILDLTVSGTKDAIMMVEAGAREVPEEQMLEAIMFAHEYIKELVEFQEQIVAEVGKPKFEYPVFLPDEELRNQVEEFAREKVYNALQTFDRQERDANMEAVAEEVKAHFSESYPESDKEIDQILHDIMKDIVRRRIIDEGIRPDGRTATEIRPISCEVGLLPRTHGSGLFKRGQTQVLTLC